MVLFPQGFNVGTTYFQSQNTSKDLYYQTVEGDEKNDTKAFLLLNRLLILCMFEKSSFKAGF